MSKNAHWKSLQEQDVLDRFAPKFKPKELKPKTEGQLSYLEAIKSNILTFCSGPAGCGKSFLACGLAAKWLESGRAKKIILTRPIVECGRKLGSLPGELHEKIDPYMGPLYGTLEEFIEPKKLPTMKADGILSSSPLELMRGKTFNDCFVILDEAQNVDREQMLMFLTRIGDNCKVVVNGDLRQIDLRYPDDSGLYYAMNRLIDKEIGRIYLSAKDIVRSGIIKRIIHLWDNQDEEDIPYPRYGES